MTDIGLSPQIHWAVLSYKMLQIKFKDPVRLFVSCNITIAVAAAFAAAAAAHYHLCPVQISYCDFCQV